MTIQLDKSPPRSLVKLTAAHNTLNTAAKTLAWPAYTATHYNTNDSDFQNVETQPLSINAEIQYNGTKSDLCKYVKKYILQKPKN